MGLWDQIHQTSRTFTSQLRGHDGRPNVTSHATGGSRPGEARFRARFHCPSCRDLLVPGVRCDHCRLWAVDASGELRVESDEDGCLARRRRRRSWRDATHARRGSVLEVLSDSTPEEPAIVTAVHAFRDSGSFTVVSAPCTVSVVEHVVQVDTTTVVYVRLARGESRSLIVGDQVSVEAPWDEVAAPKATAVWL